jgi:hypothetical protein
MPYILKMILIILAIPWVAVAAGFLILSAYWYFTQ